MYVNKIKEFFIISIIALCLLLSCYSVIFRDRLIVSSEGMDDYTIYNVGQLISNGLGLEGFLVCAKSVTVSNVVESSYLKFSITDGSTSETYPVFCENGSMCVEVSNGDIVDVYGIVNDYYGPELKVRIGEYDRVIFAGSKSESAENTDELCSDGIDNDGDGFIDCDDWDCDGTGPCGENTSDTSGDEEEGADFESEHNVNITPGFELAILIISLFIALVLLKRR